MTLVLGILVTAKRDVNTQRYPAMMEMLVLMTGVIMSGDVFMMMLIALMMIYVLKMAVILLLDATLTLLSVYLLMLALLLRATLPLDVPKLMFPAAMEMLVL
jgi:hypothetical protein